MKEKRFTTINEQTALLNHYQIIKDNETGVCYLFVKSGYGAGLTPLLDKNGKTVIEKNRR